MPCWKPSVTSWNVLLHKQEVSSAVPGTLPYTGNAEKPTAVDVTVTAHLLELAEPSF